MIRTALKLAEKGLCVFPCLPRSKVPATQHGCLDATVDPEQIGFWWTERSDYNIGIATGEASKIFVVDVDGLDAEAALSKLEAEHGALPGTIEVITARGRHIYFQMPNAPVRNSAGKIAAGIDTRGASGFVLAPPSVHPSGKRYAWSVDSARTLAAAPRWLLDRIAAPVNGAGVTPPSAWRDLARDGVCEGSRDDSAARLAGYLLRRLVDPTVTLELLQAWNATRCTPPLPPADVERICNSIAGKELRRRGDG